MKLLKSSPKCGIYTNLHICNSSFFIRRRFGENTNIWLRSVRISRSNGFKSTCESLSKDRCDLYASPLSRPNRQMSPRPTNLRQEVTSLSGIAERLSYLFRHLTRFCVKLSGLGANHHLTRVCGAIFCARKIFSGEWQLSGDNYSDMIRLLYINCTILIPLLVFVRRSNINTVLFWDYNLATDQRLSVSWEICTTRVVNEVFQKHKQTKKKWNNVCLNH